MLGKGRKAEIYYYLNDHLGTPQELVNGKGQAAWSVAYRAYGNLAVAFVKTVGQPLRFQGQYFDAESGLHYNRYRYYSPETERFITPDPIGLAGGLNQTQYVPNPTGWVDPLGLASVPGGCPETPRAKIQSELDKILSGSLDDILKIDPEAQIGYRGSLATGVKGPHKLNPDGSRKTFDPADFDVDAFVVSDKLADAVKPNRGEQVYILKRD